MAPARPLLCLAALLAFGPVSSTAPLPAHEVERIVNAIYHAEGGPKARVPYGILSVKVRSQAEARRVCANTVRNNWARWEAAGRPGPFLDFLAARYCPPSADPAGHRNWKRNVRTFYGTTRR